MLRKRMLFWGVAVVLSMGIGFSGADGNDPQKPSEKGVNSAPEKKGKKSSITVIPRSTEKEGSRASVDETDPKASKLPESKPRSVDEEAIRLTGQTFVKAYCQGDAKTIAAHFTKDAEYIDERGEVYQGRESIERAMKELFAENEGCQIEMEIETIRFISPEVAVEDGSTTFISADGTSVLRWRRVLISKMSITISMR